MRSNLIKAVGIFILVWLGAFISRKTGYYNTYWFTDISLHILSGIGFGYLVLAITAKEKINWKILSILIVSFAVLGSYFWELWEFSGWHLVPGNMEFYSPEIGDSFGDIASGMSGGVLLSIYLLLKNRKDN